MAVEVKAVADAAAAGEEEQEQYQDDDSLTARFMDWVRTELVWYAGSFTFHLLGLSLLLLMRQPDLGRLPTTPGDSTRSRPRSRTATSRRSSRSSTSARPDDKPPPELDVDPTLEKPAMQAQEDEYNDDSPVFEHKGGGMVSGRKDVAWAGRHRLLGVGTVPRSPGAGLGVGLGTGKSWGSGGDGVGFGGRGSGHRKAMLATGGGTKHTERAVTGALIWLARHQLSDGSWSLQNYHAAVQRQDLHRPGHRPGRHRRHGHGPAALPGRRPNAQAKGPYRANIAAAINWLITHQKPDGDLAAAHSSRCTRTAWPPSPCARPTA